MIPACSDVVGGGGGGGGRLSRLDDPALASRVGVPAGLWPGGGAGGGCDGLVGDPNLLGLSGGWYLTFVFVTKLPCCWL